MSNLIRAYDNQNQPLITAEHPLLRLTYFNLLRLDAEQSVDVDVPGFELLFVVLRGRCAVTVDGERFDAVGQRENIWSGQADSVYAGTGGPIHVRALAPETEVAVAGGLCNEAHAPFRVRPEDVELVDVGSRDTASRRRIYHILGSKDNGRAGNLLVSELYADPGCWSGYPPHKHDTEAPPEETAFEEVYHYRFAPETGFGGQYLYEEGEEPRVMMTRHGDTVIVDRGYHPTVTSPGHEEYIFTILVGHHQRSLIQRFEAQHTHLMDVIPGIGAMRAKFK